MGIQSSSSLVSRTSPVLSLTQAILAISTNQYTCMHTSMQSMAIRATVCTLCPPRYLCPSNLHAGQQSVAKCGILLLDTVAGYLSVVLNRECSFVVQCIVLHSVGVLTSQDLHLSVPYTANIVSAIT